MTLLASLIWPHMSQAWLFREWPKKKFHTAISIFFNNFPQYQHGRQSGRRSAPQVKLPPLPWFLCLCNNRSESKYGVDVWSHDIAGIHQKQACWVCHATASSPASILTSFSLVLPLFLLSLNPAQTQKSCATKNYFNFSFNDLKTSNLGSTGASWLQTQAPLFKFFPHSGHKPLQSSLHTGTNGKAKNIWSCTGWLISTRLPS